jgi:hypothetical protein
MTSNYNSLIQHSTVVALQCTALHSGGFQIDIFMGSFFCALIEIVISVWPCCLLQTIFKNTTLTTAKTPWWWQQWSAETCRRFCAYVVYISSACKVGFVSRFLHSKGQFISPSGISNLCGTVAGMVRQKGSMSTEGETLQVSVLPYRCSICPPLVRRQMSIL